MSLEELIASVGSVQSGEDYWRIQHHLASEVEAREPRIERTRRRHHRLRTAIKRRSEKSGRNLPDKSGRFRRLQGLLSMNEALEEEHRFARGTVLYLGDVLAYELMPEHVVRLHGRNSQPGFFRGKSGRGEEFKIGDFLTRDGWTVLMHDLTHCLRIGDLTAFCPERGIFSIEVGTGNRDRKTRQRKRMHLLKNVLNEDVNCIRPDDLAAHRLPTHLIEDESALEHNISAFIDVANCSETACKVVQPEEGVLYAASPRGLGAAALMRELDPGARAWQNYLLASFSDRITGKFSWVPPILSLSVPREPIARLLRGDFELWVFLDVDHIKRRLAELAPALTVALESDYLKVFWAHQDGLSILGPQPIENVQYGLATLESAVRMLAARAHLNLREMAENHKRRLRS